MPPIRDTGFLSIKEHSPGSGTIKNTDSECKDQQKLIIVYATIFSCNSLSLNIRELCHFKSDIFSLI